MLRGVAGLSAKESAALLDSSVAAVNSNLQRARRTLKDRLPRQRLEWTRGSEASDEERALLEGYLDAIEHADADEFVAMLCGLVALVRPGDELVNPATGLRTVFRETAACTGGELLQVDWIGAPGWTTRSRPRPRASGGALRGPLRPARAAAWTASRSSTTRAT